MSSKNYVIGKSLCRGWISEEDTGANTNYYLYTRLEFRTISPLNLFTESNNRVISVTPVANIGSYNIQVSGGVQFIELCYNLSMAEAMVQVQI